MTLLPKQNPLRSRKHRRWIAEWCCLSCVKGLKWAGRVVSQAAHIRMGLGGGMGMKPCDTKIVPLCPTHHGDQHRMGEQEFWDCQRLDPFHYASELALNSPDRDIRRRAKAAGEIA